MTVSSPYRGLAPFADSELDALYFFGRERDTDIVVANLIASRLTVLYGPSGVGKSSLLLASVARSLRKLPEEPVVVVFSVWGDEPAHLLAAALAEAAGVDGGELLDVAERVQAARDVYLILDQAEEYFTYHSQSADFEAALAEIVNRPLRVNVLLSLREDALARLDRLKGRIPGLFGNVLRLDRLDRVAGRAAIVRPLERWHEREGEEVVVEDGLVERVLDGVGTGKIELGPGGLGAMGDGSSRGIEAPYLQLVMQRLWETERNTGSATLRVASLEALGGARQIVADHLERAVGALGPQQREIAARLFDHLVTPSGTKIAHELSDLTAFAGVTQAEIQPVLGTLADHRILRADETGRWEIFHDVLAGAVLGWKTRYDAERAVDRERERLRRRHRRLGLLGLGALLGLVLMSALTLFAFSQRGEAREQARIARSGQLSASALSLLGSDPELGLALALEAAEADPGARAEDALRQSLGASRERAIIEIGRPLVSVQPSRDGSRALVVGLDQRARLIDLASRRERWSRRVDGAAAAFAPGGRTIHAVVNGSLVQLDASTGEEIGSPVELIAPASAQRLVVSPDGLSAIVIVDKPRALVVELRSGAVIGRIEQIVRVADAAFAPSGRLVASSGVDRSARLWESVGWQQLRVLRGHVGRVLAVAFDPSGHWLGTGSSDQTARIWRAGTGLPHAVLFGHTGLVDDVSFGRGGLVVTASGDGTARSWAVNGRPIQVLRGHRGSVTAAVFAGPASVLTTGLDGTLRVWDAGTARELRRWHGEGPAAPSTRAETADGAIVARAAGSVIVLRRPGEVTRLRGHRDVVNAVQFSPDGQLLVSAGRDHDVIVWDADDGAIVHRFEEAHSASVSDARFSPDGRWIVTAGPISARLWNVDDGRPLMYLYGPKPSLIAAGFEPDSRTVVTRETDGTVRRYVCELCGGIEELRALARRRLRATGRELTEVERSRFLE